MIMETQHVIIYENLSDDDDESIYNNMLEELNKKMNIVTNKNIYLKIIVFIIFNLIINVFDIIAVKHYGFNWYSITLMCIYFISNITFLYYMYITLVK
jgi:hypothetical protein